MKDKILASTMAVALMTTAGCGGGGGGSPGATGASPPVPQATVSGVAAKGLLLNAIVNFYSVTNGVEGSTPVATVRTNAQSGAFSTTVATAGPVVVTVTTDANTQMLDEVSGTAIAAPAGLVLHTVVDSVTNLQPIAVTPLTEIAYGIAKATSGSLTATNIDAANNAVSTALLNGTPILYTQPINISDYASATAAQQEQAKLLTALAVAANEGIATGASGAPCATTYSANIVCLIGGLTNIVTTSSSGALTLTSAANYINSAYTSIDSGAITIDGGKAPSALGMNVATAAETAFVTAVGKQAPLPGFDPGSSSLANTKALFANIRTNIIDQTSTQTFGFAPTLTALENDYKNNVHPVIANTSSMISAAYTASQLIVSGTTTDAAGTPSPNLENPGALTVDSTGNIYVTNQFNNTIVKVSGTTATIFAGKAGVAGAADGTGSEATFNDPAAIAADSAGNLYVADSGNYTIRKISPAGVVTTLAGTPGVSGSTDGTGPAASFSYPSAITVASNGTVYVADGNQVRTVTPGGVVSTVVIQPGSDCNSYGFYSATHSCLSNEISGIAVDGAGNIYVDDSGAFTVQEISASGAINTLAGQPGSFGSANGQGSGATFGYLAGLTLDSTGNLYVADSTNAEIRKITQAGVVTTVVGPAGLGFLGGIASDGSGGFYITNGMKNSVQDVTSAGVISTVVRGAADYRKGCAYDPVRLGTADNVALCRYGLDQGQILLTVTETGAGTYTLETQALTPAQNLIPGLISLSPLAGYVVNTSIPTLTSTFTWTTSSSGAQSASLAGPYYVTATGGQITAALNAAESSDWNAATGSGTLTLGGKLSGGAGGVGLITAQIGSDSVMTFQNSNRLFTSPVTPIISAGSSPVTVTGVLDLQEFNTGAFSYAVSASIGAPITDKSGAAAPPSSVTVTGSIDQIVQSTATPLFNGSVGVSLEGFPSFDATKAISATNYFTVQAQFAGTLNLTGGRVLTVSATANASQIVPTPALPDSLSVTYSYSTPSGTAQLNASGKYDATDGFSGTITNNAGVVIAVTDPIGSTVTGTVMASGTETATIKGAFIYYSDGTSESLF